MPYVLAGLLNLYGTIGYGGWFDILTALSPLNSVLNPIIFLSFNHRMFKPSVSYKYSRTVETRAWLSEHRSYIIGQVHEMLTLSIKREAKNVRC